MEIGRAESGNARAGLQTVTNLIRLWSGYEDTLGDARDATERLSDTLIAQLMFANSGQSLSEIQKAEGRLAHKYDVLSILDAGHPYKTNPPTV